MPTPLVITAHQDTAVVITSEHSSLTIAAGIEVLAPGAPSGVDVSAGAGGEVAIFGSITGSWGLIDNASARSSYRIVVHGEGQVHGVAGVGIGVTFGRSSIVNHGHIAAQSNGISVGGFGGNTILNNGRIVGENGVVSIGSGDVVVNSGTIHASVDGAVIGANATVTNAGAIQAGRYGISFFAGGFNILTNTGSITGALAVRGTSGVERIVNHGTITGRIDLGGANDFLDNRQGVIVGTIVLSDGNDTALGGARDETFIDWTGDDFIDAGAGIDTITYADYPGADLPVTLDLRIATAQNTGWGNDTFVGFENVIGSRANDSITGDSNHNRLAGINGNDTLLGGQGNDTLFGGSGYDLVDGGEGIDTALFESAVITVVDLRLLTVQDTGHGIDILAGIENVTSGSLGDLLTGNEQANALAGNGGGDVLSGEGGDDTLDGGIDGDLLRGGAGNDQLIGGKNGDTMDGGSGTDTAVFTGSRSLYAITWNADGTVTVADSRADKDGADRLTSVELARFHDGTISLAPPPPPPAPPPAVPGPLTLRGTVRADRLSGGDLNDSLFGGAGNDVAIGNGGNDRIWGGSGKDTLYGGAGRDVFAFDTRPNKISNVDRIMDFSVADDTIHLSRAVFKNAGKSGALSKAAFWTGDKAHDATDRLIYSKKSGALLYDSDGTGDATAVRIATLSKNLKMTALDFFVV